MKVAAPAPVHKMVGGVSWGFVDEPLRSTLTKNLSKTAAGISLRCAAHEYRLMASGHTHFTVYNKLMPWDHAPGWLMHQEAGGYSALLDGSPYRPDIHKGGLLCAPDRASWHALHDALLIP